MENFLVYIFNYLKCWWGWRQFSYNDVETQEKIVLRRAFAYTFVCLSFPSLMMYATGIGLIDLLFFGILCLSFSTILNILLSSHLANQISLGDETTRTPTKGYAEGAGKLLNIVGAWGVIGLAFVFTFQSLQRIWFNHNLDFNAVYFLAIALTAFFAIFPMWRIRNKQKRLCQVPWLTIGFGIGFASILFAWLTISIIWKDAAVKDIFSAFYTKEDGKTIECKNRQSEHNPNTEGIAVTLSGGGYRAALIHAGLLAYFDENNLPIDMMSTVSGGSIIGAAVSLGISPTAFATALHEKKPGLPKDLMTIWSVVGDVFTSKSLTERYAEHFQRVFFRQQIVGQLRDKPFLLVNVTDIEANPSNARVALYKGLDSDGDCDLIANIVAASGAYPGPFQPKKFRWPNDKEHGNSVRKYADGGVVENLGIEGIVTYFSKPLGADHVNINKPRILIISDASGHGNPTFFRAKADIVSIVTGSFDISFELLQRETYALLTGHPDFIKWLGTIPISEISDTLQMPFSTSYENLIEGVGDNKALLTIPIPATSAVMSNLLVAELNCEYEAGVSASKIQREVRDYPTLDELEPERIRKAFWLGKVMGRTYFNAIRRAHDAIKGFDSCFDIQHRQLPSCPSSDVASLFPKGSKKNPT